MYRDSGNARSFRKEYPVPLAELLVAPVIFRGSLPCLADEPFVTAAGMRDLAEFGGHGAGAIRTALHRLRAAGAVETFEDPSGLVRYRTTALARSVTHAVLGRSARPEGFLLAVFSFAAEDVRERQIVRDALRLHGFQKLAQNVYLNGQIDTSELRALLEASGVAENVYLFSCPEADDPVLRRRLPALFDLAGRKKVLARLQRALAGFLEEPGLPDDEFARRYFYAGPVHYRITYAEEPPLPARYLPPDYPLDALDRWFAALGERRSEALVRYHRRVNGAGGNAAQARR